MFGVRKLIEILPEPSGALPEADNPRTGDTHLLKPSPPNGYVEPSLNGELLPDTRVVLIAATAAVGKSALASFLAEQTESLLFDLSNARLGDGFVGGLTSTAFLIENRACVDRMVRDGEACLILDALDEALIAPGGLGGLESFISSLSRMEAVNESGRPRVVILGRIDAIEYARMELEEVGMRASYLELAYFDEAQSLQYVRKEIDEMAEADPSPDDRPTDLELRHAFEHVAASLGNLVQGNPENDIWADDVAQSFIGYAPVLAAIAALLTEGGWRNVTETFSTTELRGGLYQAVQNICKQILDREMHKFEDRLRTLDIPGLAELSESDAYSPEIQLRMLLSRSPVLQRVYVPRQVPENKHSDYRDAVGTFFEQHPFLSIGKAEAPSLTTRFQNTVFRDYALAVSSIASADGSSVDWFDGPVGKLGFMYGRLLIVISHLEKREIDSAALPFLLDSLSQSRIPEDATDVHIAEGTEAGLLSVSVIVDTSDEGSNELVDAAIRIKDKPLRFNGRLARLRVDLPEATISIGPTWTRLAAPLSITCAHLDVVTTDALEIASSPTPARNDEAPRVVLDAKQIVDQYGQNLNIANADLLRVRSNDASYPWSEYLIGPSAEEPPNGSFTHALGELQSVGRWFNNLAKRQPDREFGVDQDTFDLAVRKRKFDGTVVQHLKDCGAIWDSNGTYRLKLPSGISLFKLVHDDLDGSERALLYDLLQPVI